MKTLLRLASAGKYRVEVAQLVTGCFTLISFFTALAGLAVGQEASMSNAGTPTTPPNSIMLNECLIKGHMGIVGPSIWVATSSQKNELILPDQSHWTGQDKQVRQMVCILNGKVFDPAGNNQNNFSMVESVFVSFEGDKVYFFNFMTLKGGFYRR